MIPNPSAPSEGRLKRIIWLLGASLSFVVVPLVGLLIADLLHVPPLGVVAVAQFAVIPVVFLFALLDGDGARSLGLTAGFGRRDLGTVMLLALLHIVGSAVTSIALALHDPGAIEGLPAAGDLEQFGQLDAGSFLLVGGGIALLTGVGEELLFRGYLISRLERLGLSAVACVVLSALLFGLAHWPGYGLPLSLSKAVWFGVPAGIFFWHRRSLWPLVIMHAVVNGFAFLALYLGQKLL